MAPKPLTNHRLAFLFCVTSSNTRPNGPSVPHNGREKCSPCCHQAQGSHRGEEFCKRPALIISKTPLSRLGRGVGEHAAMDRRRQIVVSCNSGAVSCRFINDGGPRDSIDGKRLSRNRTGDKEELFHRRAFDSPYKPASFPLPFPLPPSVI